MVVTYCVMNEVHDHQRTDKLLVLFCFCFFFLFFLPQAYAFFDEPQTFKFVNVVQDVFIAQLLNTLFSEPRIYS